MKGANSVKIIGEGTEDPEQLLANPANWRIHPLAQREALDGVLEKIGWVQRIVVNQRTGHVVDGHLRADLAVQRQEKAVPVLYVDLSEDEERAALAALDPIAGMAVADVEKLAELAASIDIKENEPLSLRLDAMTGLNIGMDGAPDFGDGPTGLPATGVSGGNVKENERIVLIFNDEDEVADFWRKVEFDPIDGRIKYWWSHIVAGAVPDEPDADE